MHAPSSLRAPVLRSRPPSEQNFPPPPSRSEAYPYTVPRQHLKDKTIRGSILEPSAPRKGLRLKIAKEKSFGGGSLSTVTRNSKSPVPNLLQSSKSKAATVSSRPASQSSTRHNVSSEESTNAIQVVTPLPLAQKQVSHRQELGPENWTPITAKAIADSPPPRMRIHKHRRATILPKAGTTSLFHTAQSPPNQKYKDVFYDQKLESPTSISQSSLAAPSYSFPTKLPVHISSPKPVSELQKTRSALTLPRRQLKWRARAISKTVTWDPSIVPLSPETLSTSDNPPEEEHKHVPNNSAPSQVKTRKADVKDCVETIKEWGKADRSKLVSLIEALKELELDIEDKTKEDGNLSPSTSLEEEVRITTVKSMNPRVPEFESFKSAKARNKTDHVDEYIGKQSTESEINLFLDSDCNKENIPQNPLQLPAKSRGHDLPRKKKRVVTVLDDYNSPGREVDAFANWYGEMQLTEFAKRYPLTGRRASEVRQAANISAKVAQVSENARCVPEAPLAASRVISSNIRIDPNVSTCQDPKHPPEILPATRDDFAKPGKAHGNSHPGRRNWRPRRRDLPSTTASTDPSARQNAAVIQQRLEVLLLKEKERKAFEDMSEETRAALSSALASVDYFSGLPAPTWCWDGGFYGAAAGIGEGAGAGAGMGPGAGMGMGMGTGLECVRDGGSSGNGGSVWIPSERLRL